MLHFKFPKMVLMFVVLRLHIYLLQGCGLVNQICTYKYTTMQF